MKLFCKGQFLLLISGEDRDETLLQMVGEEIEIEAEESQDQEVRDDYEHEADVDPIHDPLANVTKKSDIHWHHTSFIPVDTTWESPTTDPCEPLTLHDVAGQKRVAMERRPESKQIWLTTCQITMGKKKQQIARLFWKNTCLLW